MTHVCIGKILDLGSTDGKTKKPRTAGGVRRLENVAGEGPIARGREQEMEMCLVRMAVHPPDTVNRSTKAETVGPGGRGVWAGGNRGVCRTRGLLGGRAQDTQPEIRH